jgi:hypothetical protein
MLMFVLIPIFSIAKRILSTHHDQLLLSGPEPPGLDAWLESLESSNKICLQLLWASVKPCASATALNTCLMSNFDS